MERRCRQCVPCKTPFCKKGASSSCSACRNPAFKKGCLLRDPCSKYGRVPATEGNSSADEIAKKSQNQLTTNLESDNSGVDERVQLSQYMEEVVLGNLEANLPNTPPRLAKQISRESNFYYAEQEEARSQSKEPNNLVVHISPLGYDGIPSQPQERRPDKTTKEEQRPPEQQQNQYNQDVYSPIESEDFEYELSRVTRGLTENNSPVRQNIDSQDQDGESRNGNNWAIVNALEEVECEMINIKEAYSNDATHSEIKTLRQHAQELHHKLRNIGD